MIYNHFRVWLPFTLTLFTCSFYLILFYYLFYIFTHSPYQQIGSIFVTQCLFLENKLEADRFASIHLVFIFLSLYSNFKTFCTFTFHLKHKVKKFPEVEYGSYLSSWNEIIMTFCIGLIVTRKGFHAVENEKLESELAPFI